jgi:tRNA (guanine-N7-)-methyltransferase
MRRTLKDYPQVSLKIQDLDGRIDLFRLFGRSAPFHIEIGVGRGTFLLNQAKTHPQTDFLGIEWTNKYYLYSVDRIGRWNLTNVRIIRTDAASFLTNFLPDTSVDCFHIYFPDPWPKKRHHKRRFFNTTNTDQLLRCLKPAGHLRIATDHADYFKQIKSVIAEKANSLEKIDFLPAAGADTGEWIGSNFERKYLKENRPIFCLAVRKKYSPKAEYGQTKIS